jgi:hypothetical protein
LRLDVRVNNAFHKRRVARFLRQTRGEFSVD